METADRRSRFTASGLFEVPERVPVVLLINEQIPEPLEWARAGGQFDSEILSS